MDDAEQQVTCVADDPLSLDVLVHCDICPRNCGVDRASGQHGVCGQSDEMRISRAALHFWEEPVISGDAGSGTIFFTGCNLGCIYCQNRRIARSEAPSADERGALADDAHALGIVISETELAKTMMDLEAQGALNINMVTPTHFSPQVRRSIAAAREMGLELPIVWNTGGYESAHQIRLNKGFADVYLTDFKYADERDGASLSHAGDYPSVALVALREMIESTGGFAYDVYNGQERITRGVIVRHLILPGRLEESKHVLDMLHAEFGSSIRLSLMNQYTPVLATDKDTGDMSAADALNVHPELAQTVPDDEYERLLDHADSIGIEDYFWQEGGACQESFIPDFQ